MKRSLLVILLVCFFGQFSEAQLWKLKKFEAVAGAGPSFFFGDVGGFSRKKNILGIRDVSYLQTRFNLNINLKYRLTQDINARVSLTYAILHATDQRGSNEEREFESTTSIFEPALIGEYYFIKNSAEDSYLFSKGRNPGILGFFKTLDFYVFTGIGGLSYTLKENDLLLDRNLNKSGFTAVIPVGVGTTLVYSPNLNFGVELGGRYSFSDYLDGYSSQYSSANDVYYFFNFTITYKLKTGPNGGPSFR